MTNLFADTLACGWLYDLLFNTLVIDITVGLILSLIFGATEMSRDFFILFWTVVSSIPSVVIRVANKQADRRIVRSLEYVMVRDRCARSILTTV